MRILRRCVPLPVICTVALFASTARGEDTKDAKAELTALVTKTAELLNRNDVDGFVASLSPDWKLVTTEGAVMNREQVVALLKGGKIRFTSYRVGDLDVRVFGDAAVVIGRNESALQVEESSVHGKDRFTDLFVRRDGQWRCVSTHSSRLTDEH